MDAFSELLRTVVQETLWHRGIEQVELGRRAGLSQSAISKFLHGERFLSPEAIDRVLEALGLEIVIRPRKRERKDG